MTKISIDKETVEAALHICACYAEFIRSDLCNNLECHPYLPEIDDAIKSLHAALSTAQVEPAIGDRKLMAALSRYINPVLQELQFERGTGSLAAHNLRLCLIEVDKALNGTRNAALDPGVGFPLAGITPPSPSSTAQPSCPDCAAPGLLYECVHCGNSNYPPAEPQSAQPLPEAWLHTYRQIPSGGSYTQADLGELGPTPKPGYRWIGKAPLYAHPAGGNP